jgi:hypothetical protein
MYFENNIIIFYKIIIIYMVDKPFEVDNLLFALDDETNHSILNLTSKKIEEMKHNILSDIGIPDEIKNEFISKLQNYIYMDEIPDIKVGSFIRWIPLSNPDKIILTRGGNICDINITDKGTSIVVKNYFGKGMQVSMDKALIFRKLNDDELILLSAMNYLQPDQV